MSARRKVLSLERLRAELEPLRAQGTSLALANGLFDLLHVGHLRYLQAAAGEADLLVVAVNSDASARALRGPCRPLVPGAERAELVAGFACVDYVTIFDELTVEPLLSALAPDVHCKGTDYTPEQLPEAELAERLGIRIAIVGDPKDHDTSEMIRRIRDRPDR